MQQINYFLSFGPTVIMPVVFIVMGLCLKVRPLKAISSSVTVGIGFLGVSLITGMFSEHIGDAVVRISDRFSLALNVIDLGWPVAASIAFQSAVGILIIPLCMLVNLLMLITGITRTINIDIWNYWHFAFTGAVVFHFSGSIVWSILAGMADFLFTMIVADMAAPSIKRYYGLDNITFPNAYSVCFMPVVYLLNAGFSKLESFFKSGGGGSKSMKRLPDPVFIGLGLGIVLGMLASYSLKDLSQFTIVTASMMILMPRVAQLLAEGLEPIVEAIKKKVEQRKNGRLLIGMTPSLIIGNPKLMASSILLIPIIVFISFIVPGNQFLPVASLSGIVYLLPLVVSITGGSMVRILFIGTFLSAISNWLVSAIAPVFTPLVYASSAAQIPAGSLAGSLDYGSSPLVYLLYLTYDNRPLFIGILAGLIIVLTVFGYMTAKRRKIPLEEGEQGERGRGTCFIEAVPGDSRVK